MCLGLQPDGCTPLFNSLHGVLHVGMHPAGLHVITSVLYWFQNMAPLAHPHFNIQNPSSQSLSSQFQLKLNFERCSVGIQQWFDRVDAELIWRFGNGHGNGRAVGPTKTITFGDSLQH